MTRRSAFSPEDGIGAGIGAGHAPTDPHGHAQTHGHGHAHGPARRPRDPRLDFFRGLAMFIILIAHTPGNTWTLWIPARFGFSDATEIFVFCSGMASAMAFGAVFAQRSWFLGAARIAYRVWQVYWAHVGMVIVVIAFLYLIDRNGWGLEGVRYVATVPVVPLFDNTGEALLGLLTLRWVPNYFDILPMYLVILAMVPLIMLAHRVGGVSGAAALVLGLWLAAQFGYLDLPSRPWRTDVTWFFNPFGWQLVFFTGFAFAMRWLPAPPVTRGLVIAAIVVVVTALPFAWFKIHQGIYLPYDWAVTRWIADARAATDFLWWKSWVGAWRYLHFMAVAYLAWVSVGPGGVRLARGWGGLGPLSRRGMWVAGAVALATVPYAYIEQIAEYAPLLNAGIVLIYGDAARAVLGFDFLVDEQRIGLFQFIHLIALVPLLWSLIGMRARAWIGGVGWVALVPVIRKVGQQSLAVFLVSMLLGRFNGWWLDMIGRDVWTRALVNGTGILALIATAYLVGWFKSQPWRAPHAAKAPRRAKPGATADGARGVRHRPAALGTPAE